ncbi:MAG: DNA topoisomerase [Lachnospiraceae bacterium]|jgi:DNA topoisomerase-3|nr:DNA topoisomerase [Lachnospiraceae bacterium]MCH4030383.1 DNA topoisomerase [Lachnospiraceae bacterium]MCH4107469.1 DNA topoisomerase [Lachnospiraceae bacterium]MCI1360122.1 DNA topoisomerase [Lachnospiraceae bacterium]MCI1379592.1 DNA topoisomerase [Lachnospiraceae bacterium]
MDRYVFIAEKPSVARQFADALHLKFNKRDGYLESENTIVTWCVGHLVTMSYPESYDPKLKKWSFDTLPFIPETFKYEVIKDVRKQFEIVKKILMRDDVRRIYVCTDSGREGEYIYRLVRQEAGVTGKDERRVWIDSQTEEEIHRGIKEAKPESEYDSLADAAYLRAKEDYLMGINFSRAMTLKYGNGMASFLHRKYAVISIGRVMTCVLGMVVRREREIRKFVPETFYRVSAKTEPGFEADWKLNERSAYAGDPQLYRDSGFKKKEKAEEMIRSLASGGYPVQGVISAFSNRQEIQNPPLLYNLAEIQNDCSKRFHISPDQTLQIIQELYEKRLVTYPRTDARVLSSAVAKEINRNIRGLVSLSGTDISTAAGQILKADDWKKIGKTRYTNDKLITDHYAIIPTGNTGGAGSLDSLKRRVYELICRRFLSIFMPPAKYRKIALTIDVPNGEHMETFTASVRVLTDPGYRIIAGLTDKDDAGSLKAKEETGSVAVPAAPAALQRLRKGDKINILAFAVREGQTTPPRRYTTGSMILAMENAGQLIEDEELREQIKGSGIGTSATRAEILSKLERIRYLSVNKKTQVMKPTLYGEMVYDAVDVSMRQMLNPELTASWEKGLTMVAEGTIGEDEYMDKLKNFIIRRTDQVKQAANQGQLQRMYAADAAYYKKGSSKTGE